MLAPEMSDTSNSQQALLGHMDVLPSGALPDLSGHASRSPYLGLTREVSRISASPNRLY